MLFWILLFLEVASMKKKDIFLKQHDFLYWGDGESPLNQPKIWSFLPHPPLPTKFLFPPHQKSIQPNKKIKTSLLAVVIAPVPFLF